VNITLVTLFFFLTNTNVWWIAFMMTISHVYIYAWDDYRFKRGSQRSHFATQEIGRIGQYMSVFPCATLAGAFMFKYYGGLALVKSWAPDRVLREHSEIWIAVGSAFCLHLVVHSLVLTFVVPRYVPQYERQENIDLVPYTETASSQACNWFNANPTHCLRSQYVYRHSPHHVYYIPGKEDLHRKNTNPRDASALIIYENVEFDPEAAWSLDEVAEEVKAMASEAKQEAANAVKRLSSASLPKQWSS